MKEIKSIELVLENCEVIEIGRENIGIFFVLDIKRSISRKAVNSISDSTTMEELFMQISSNANNIKSYITTWSENKKPFERLMCHEDITAIDINYQDNTNEYISVKWGGNSDYTNIYQTSAMNQYTGDLYIVISKKETAELYFSDYLNEKESDWFWY